MQRLAESLDADIKRWATGKEGNLRALLSTLQYVCIDSPIYFTTSVFLLYFVIKEYFESDKYEN